MDSREGTGVFARGEPGFCELSPDGRIERANSGLGELLGRSGDALVGLVLADVCEGLERPRVMDALARVSRTGTPETLDCHLADSLVSLVLARVEGARGEARVLGVVTDLTERGRMVEAMRSSEERYRALFQSIDEGFCVLEVLLDDAGQPNDFLFLEVNPAFERQTGLRQVEGKRVRQLLREVDPWWFRVYGEVALTGRSVRSEHQAPGMHLWFDVFAFRVGPEGSRRLALVIENVTERKQRQSSAQFHEELHDALEGLSTVEEILEAAGRRIATHLDVQRVTFVEVLHEDVPTAEELPPSEPRPERLEQEHQSRSPRLARALAEFPWVDHSAQNHGFDLDTYLSASSLTELAAGQTVCIDSVDGRRVSRSHVEENASGAGGAEIHVPHLKDGELRHVLSVQQERPRRWRQFEVDSLRELSARVWLRLERARAEEALRRSESRVRVALGAAEMGVWTWGPEDDQLTYDARTAEMFDIPPGHTSTTEWVLRERVHPADAPEVRTRLREACRPGGTGRLRVEFRIRLPAREERWILGYGALEAPSVSGSGVQRTTIAGICIDITERKRAEQALRESDRRKDEFLATLAHELRNPLAPLEHGLQIMRLSGGAAPGGERVQEIMTRQVEHMCRLVDDLLEVSRITRGKIELRRERVDLGRVIRGALETSASLIERAEHELTVSLPGEPLIVDGDAVRLAQVFANLLNNAVKYTDPPGVIEVSARRNGGSVVVSVRDNGVGIRPEMLPRIFDMFTQAERSPDRSQVGLGIGLTLVRSLIQMHGGTVEARSEGPGRGAEFLVHLPLAEERRRFPRRSDQNFATLSSACRVLVVDDNRDAAESLGTLLEMIGADVRVEYDGPRALAALENYRPTVALLDLGMPGMDGFEVARRIQEHPAGQDVTLIAITGWGQEEDRRRTRRAGFDHHLVKPADITKLQQLLGSLN
jgi:PAS domain S-box-containing protein